MAKRVLPGTSLLALCAMPGLALCAMPGGIHHSVVVVGDLDASLRFYRDGLGLDLLQDRHVEGDWPDLFNAPSRHVRAVFLGDAANPDDHAGVLELNAFEGDVRAGLPPAPPRTGFLLLSFFVDLEATLSRLAALGLGCDRSGPAALVRSSDRLVQRPSGPATVRSSDRPVQRPRVRQAAMPELASGGHRGPHCSHEESGG